MVNIDTKDAETWLLTLCHKFSTDEDTEKSMEAKILHTCRPLTLDQRSEDWFTLRQFILMATDTTKLLLQQSAVADAFNFVSEASPSQESDTERFSSPCQSGFSQKRSTGPMMRGARSEHATLTAMISCQ